ncbi:MULTISPECIES: DUF2441 domain-containing protein [unclassified Bacillus (in: firmicutes)]|uniref:DUF2441 domain-containing protein n=1 Tax=unclassified Bacillus (in: firmicutes) TaxID=185979 RepID=UPI0006988854|nr:MULTISPECIES: DUF2441 domain-containing protein [unclassified Bacillus (in: firmicutes)]
MRIVNGEKFYHINRITDGNRHGLLKLGQIIDTDLQTYNPFFDVYNTDDITLYSNLTSLVNAVTYYWHFARETALEEVRVKSFPDYPSRTRCLWISDEGDLSYWLEQCKRDEMQLVELEVDGKIHECDASLIEGPTIGLNKVREKALRYWNGDIIDPFKKEILFEGKAKVVSIR